MITLNGEPESLKEARLLPDAQKWIKAWEEELKTLIEMKAFTVVPRPGNTKIISSKIVFKLKSKNGIVSWYKALCCARGFTQTYGVNFTDTHAVMAHPTAIRTVLAWGVENGYFIYQTDIKLAFISS
eukprot:597413-Rhodomonas_salina.1